jgi:hypothetical protein
MWVWEGGAKSDFVFSRPSDDGFVKVFSLAIKPIWDNGENGISTAYQTNIITKK